LIHRDEHLAFELALHRVPGINACIKHQLIQYFKTAKDAMSACDHDLRQAGLSQKVLKNFHDPDWQGVEKDLAWLQQSGNSIVGYRDTEYPSLLKEIYDPPYLLFIKGDASLLRSIQISMVGSRRPTAAGKQIARHLARELVSNNLVITSGLALGVDSMSHQGALEAHGKTLAVLGNGLDRIYPEKNQGLAEAILESGTIISEYPVGTPPLKQNFPTRNRIISGLSVGTIVIEAAKRSGSLITAKLAAEQGREVFAIPGSILNPLSEGCHWLLKQGAKLTETATDVLEELMTDNNPRVDECAGTGSSEISAICNDKKYHILLDMMGFEAITADELVQTSGLTTAEVSSMLLNMELSGILVSQLDGTYIRVV